MTQGKIVAMSLACAAALASCSKPDDAGDVKPLASVTTAAAVRGDAVESAIAYGAVEFAPGAEQSLTAPVEATLVKIIAPVGSRVSAGQAVAALKPSPASALELGKTRNDAVAADAALARMKRLRAAGLASDADVETALAAAKVADAASASVQSRSGGALVLKATAPGVVEAATVDVGGLAAQGAPVVKIGALGDLRVRLGVEPAQAARARPGMRARLSATSGDRAVDGVISAVDPRLDPQTRQAAIYLKAPAGAFAPGEPIKGVIEIGARHGATLIPRVAVVYDQDQPNVFVAQGGVAHRRVVTLGIEDGDRVQVTQGLAPGERVIVGGAAALEDGIAIKEAAPTPAGPAE